MIFHVVNVVYYTYNAILCREREAGENSLGPSGNGTSISNTVVSVKLGSIASDSRLAEKFRVRIPIDGDANGTATCVFWNITSG